jgi:hypothetical protein
MNDVASSHSPVSPVTGRRPLGNAEGVLIALRHCTADEAFDELVAAARRQRVPIFTLASALVDLAAGHGDESADIAARAAESEWADLLGRQGRSS